MAKLRMNRTLKEAAVQRDYYESREQLRAHLADFLAAYNFAKRLKTLCGLTPHEYVCKIWTENPGRFRLDPIHHTGLASERINAKSLGHHRFLQLNASTTPAKVRNSIGRKPGS
jgi:hypothetical protein